MVLKDKEIFIINGLEGLKTCKDKCFLDRSCPFDGATTFIYLLILLANPLFQESKLKENFRYARMDWTG